MESISIFSSAKESVQLDLNVEVVRQARHHTDDLSAVVDVLLADYVRSHTAPLATRQANEVVAVLNAFGDAHGSFADEYSRL